MPDAFSYQVAYNNGVTTFLHFRFRDLHTNRKLRIFYGARVFVRSGKANPRVGRLSYKENADDATNGRETEKKTDPLAVSRPAVVVGVGPTTRIR